jgi:hypothetical protein
MDFNNVGAFGANRAGNGKRLFLLVGVNRYP